MPSSFPMLYSPRPNPSLPDFTKQLDALMEPPKSAGSGLGGSGGLMGMMRQMMAMQRMAAWQQNQQRKAEEYALGRTKEERKKNLAKLQLEQAAQEAVNDPEYLQRFRGLWDFSSVKRVDELNKLKREYIDPLAKRHEVDPQKLRDLLTAKTTAEFNNYKKEIADQSGFFTGTMENLKAAGRRLKDLYLELPGAATDEERLQAARKREEAAAADRAANPALQDAFLRQQEGEGVFSRPGLGGSVIGAIPEMAPYAAALIPYVGPAIAGAYGAAQGAQGFTDTTVLAQPDQQKQLAALQGPERVGAAGVGAALGVMPFRLGSALGATSRGIQRATGMGALGRAIKEAGSKEAAEAAATRLANEAAVKASERGWAQRAARGAAEEAGTFGLIGAGQQMSTNALVNSAAGTDIPVTAGALDAAILGALPGALMGGVRGAAVRPVRPYTRRDGSPREKTAEQYGDEWRVARETNTEYDPASIIKRIKADDYAPEQFNQILNRAGISGEDRAAALSLWNGRNLKKAAAKVAEAEETPLSEFQQGMLKNVREQNMSPEDTAAEALRQATSVEQRRQVLSELADILAVKRPKAFGESIEKWKNFRKWLDDTLRREANAEDFAGADEFVAGLEKAPFDLDPTTTPAQRLAAEVSVFLEGVRDAAAQLRRIGAAEFLVNQAKLTSAERGVAKSVIREHLREMKEKRTPANLMKSAEKVWAENAKAYEKGLINERAERLRQAEKSAGKESGAAAADNANRGMATDTQGTGEQRAAGNNAEAAESGGTAEGGRAGRAEAQNERTNEAAPADTQAEGRGTPENGKPGPVAEPAAGGKEPATGAGKPAREGSRELGSDQSAEGVSRDQQTPVERVTTASKQSPGNLRDVMRENAKEIKWTPKDIDSLMYALAKKAAPNDTGRLNGREQGLVARYNKEFVGSNPFTNLVGVMLNDPTLAPLHGDVNGKGFQNWLDGYMDASVMDYATDSGLRPFC